jgi:hypothetical protein
MTAALSFPREMADFWTRDLAQALPVLWFPGTLWDSQHAGIRSPARRRVPLAGEGDSGVAHVRITERKIDGSGVPGSTAGLAVSRGFCGSGSAANPVSGRCKFILHAATRPRAKNVVQSAG